MHEIEPIIIMVSLCLLWVGLILLFVGMSFLCKILFWIIPKYKGKTVWKKRVPKLNRIALKLVTALPAIFMGSSFAVLDDEHGYPFAMCFFVLASWVLFHDNKKVLKIVGKNIEKERIPDKQEKTFEARLFNPTHEEKIQRVWILYTFSFLLDAALMKVLGWKWWIILNVPVWIFRKGLWRLIHTALAKRTPKDLDEKKKKQLQEIYIALVVGWGVLIFSVVVSIIKMLTN